MKFWNLLRWLGMAVFIAICLLGWFGAERNPGHRNSPDMEVRSAPNLVR